MKISEHCKIKFHNSITILPFYYYLYFYLKRSLKPPALNPQLFDKASEMFLIQKFIRFFCTISIFHNSVIRIVPSLIGRQQVSVVIVSHQQLAFQVCACQNCHYSNWQL